MSEFNLLLEKYKKKLGSLEPEGLSLTARIISTISLQRDIDKNIFSSVDPSTYIPEIFERQFVFIELIDHFVKIMNLKTNVSNSFLGSEEEFGRDKLHIDLFNDTWKTLTMSDPLNNYQKWIDVIKGRLELNNLNKKFFEGKTCIDIGCGTGRFSFCMANLGADVWGIDPGPESISFAQKLATELEIKNTNFLVQNAYDIEFEDNFFDFAVCNGVLHHLDNPLKALQEIYRVLKPGGKFWLYVEGSGGIYHDVWNVIQQSFIGIPYERTFEIIKKLNIPDIHLWMDIFYAKYNFISFEENKKRLQDVGFKTLKVMKSSELFDIDIQMFKKDEYVKSKFGDGGIRVLASK